MPSNRALGNQEWINKGVELYPPGSILDRLLRLEKYAAVKVEATGARRLNALAVFFLMLFAVVVPHSVAAAHISLGLSFLAWLFRDLWTGRPRFGKTTIDLPLALFCLLTILSSLLSVEPSTSIPKLKTLLLFGGIYLISTNLNRRGAPALIFLLMISSLVSVGFSLTEKAWGRGMVITEIEPSSPLRASGVQAGDVIWMVGRRRVFSVAAATQAIRGYRPGEKINVEALHSGDPIPVELTATPELLARANPLGIGAEGRTRQFRVAGFSRQFLTYAEQMQILALLAWGGLLTFLRFSSRRWAHSWIYALTLIFTLFSLALILTASRAVIASFVMAVVLTSISLGSIGGRMAVLIGLIVALSLTGIGIYTISTSRGQESINFRDDSASRRIAYMQSGLRVIPKRPLLGVGMDSHKLHWSEWGFPGDYITHTHSTPIQIAMDRGLLTLIAWAWLIIAMMVAAWFCWREARKRADLLGESLGLGTLAALTGFSISSMANYNFGDAEVMMMLLTLVGLVAVTLREYPGNKAQ
ncbi:MAG: O-antigen ligase family protein [Acidobacteriota bacterium]|nr:MAG: O-antigen ligase family protein [Acidobacteriota bacterium]